MELWPALSSSAAAKKRQSKTNKGKGKPGANENWTNYPVIDHGSLSAATLVKVGDGLEWRTVHSSRKGSLICQGTPDKVYPCTRSKESGKTNASLRTRADQGASFLRTFHPDADIPFDIIKDALKEDDLQRKRAEEFDPFTGGTLCATYLPDGTRKKCIALAFPTGTLGNELNVSPITYRVNSILFQPTTLPAWTFGTPILQITSSATHPAIETKDQRLAVRTYGQVSLFDIRNQVFARVDSKKLPFALSEVATIHSSDLRSSSDGAIVDMSFAGSDSDRLLLVTERGAGYQYLYEEGRKTIDKIFDGPSSGDGSFWRLVSDQTVNGGIVASDRSVQRFDTRTFGLDASLLVCDDGRNVITSLCRTEIEHLYCISTTSQVIWLDERYTKQPLLGWKHHRAFDRNLSVQTMEFENTSIAILGSSKSSRVTAIVVGKVQDGPLQCQMSPLAIPSPSSALGIPITSRALFRHPGIPSGSFSLVELTAQGSLHRQELRYVTDASTISPGREHVKGRFDYAWSKDVRALEKREKDLKDEVGKLEGRNLARVDLSELYGALFGEEARQARVREEEARAEEVYETLENMPTYWQRVDTGDENMRTLFDIAFSGSQPTQESRADFLTGTVLHSTRGYRARRQGRIPVDEVAKKAAWHLDMWPILKRISPDVFRTQDTEASAGSDGGDGNLKGLTFREPYRLKRDESVLEADRRENEAREQLALDLALASDVFSPIPIKMPTSTSQRSNLNTTTAEGVGGESKTQEDATSLTQETEKLSLTAKEPPHVQFSFLRPVLKDGKKYYRDYDALAGTEKDEGKNKESPAEDDKAEDSEIAKMPLGVRLLLSEWKLGEDPYKYEYVDLYGLDTGAQPSGVGVGTAGTSQNQGQSRRRQQQRAEVESEEEMTPPTQQAPPTIIASRTLAAREKEKEKEARARARTPIGRLGVSQTEMELAGESSSQTQPPMLVAQTQVEPERFGGRQPVVKKKPPKKRIGGF